MSRTQNRLRASAAARTWLATAAVAAVVLVGACGEDGETPTRPEDPAVTLPEGGVTLPESTDAPEPEPAPEPTEAPEPEPTEAPEPAPEDEPESTPEEPTDSDDGLTSEQWILIVLAGLAVLAILGVLISRQTAKTKNDDLHADTLRARIDGVVTRGRWVVEQGVPAYRQAADPAAVAATWSSLDGQLLALEQDVGALGREVGPDDMPTVTSLTSAMTGLRASLNDWQRIRSTTDDTVAAQSADAATAMRTDEMARAIGAVTAIRP